MAQNRKRKRKRTRKPAGPRLQKRSNLGIGFLRKIPWGVWTFIAVLALVVTLLEGYPWLSIEENANLDERNPYSTMFLIANEGYVPATDVTVDCKVSSLATDVGSTAQNLRLTARVASFMTHSQRRTLPCFQMIGLDNSVSFAEVGDLTMTVTYSLFPFSPVFSGLRRNQVFHFKSISSHDGRIHWEFVD
jgi:hypothetical protein